MKFKIGEKSLLEEVPISIKIDGDPYILSKRNDEVILYNAICPHQHNIVSELNEKEWRCPSHGWTFNPETGCSINAPQESLKEYVVIEKDGFLFVDIKKEKEIRITKLGGAKILPKLSIVGNAALLVEWKSYNILFDPWIEGPAVFGSWATYPPANIKVEDLPKIDAIMISHEHSDHFHEYTLKKFDKDIQIFVPNLDDCRLEKRLREFGFKNITSLISGSTTDLSDEIKVTSFLSGSVWNDSIFFLQLGGFSILNVNDAGFNWRIKKIIDSVDLLCIQFSPASGYPATWDHIDEKSKVDIIEKRNIGMLRMIKQIVEIMNPDYILPFANFNQLYLPEHMQYVKMQQKNTPYTVIDFLKDSAVKVLDIFPGESWDGNKDVFVRRDDRKQFFREKHIEKFVMSQNLENNELFIPKEFDLSFEEINSYFSKFSDSKIVKEIGKYNLEILVDNKESGFGIVISFKDGQIFCEKKERFTEEIHMFMRCPGPIVQKIIKEDLSWDELQSGYWCKYHRDPDVYNVSMWKLFHAPWRARKDFQESDSEFNDLNDNIAIADLIEQGNEDTIEILEKFGLYCAGCESSIGENLRDGCSLHGLNENDTKRLMKKLSNSLKKNR